MRLTEKEKKIAQTVFGTGLFREKISKAIEQYTPDYDEKSNVTDWFMDAIIVYRKM